MATTCETEETTARNYATRLFAWEAGELDSGETASLFQYLIDTGIAWRLQGRIGRFAVDLIESGECAGPESA